MLIYTDSSRACRFHVNDRALFDELKQSYSVINEERMILNAPPSAELDSYTKSFFNNRAALRRALRRDVRDNSRRLRQSDELAEQERQRESSDVTVSTLDDLASALQGGS